MSQTEVQVANPSPAAHNPDQTVGVSTSCERRALDLPRSFTPKEFPMKQYFLGAAAGLFGLALMGSPSSGQSTDPREAAPSVVSGLAQPAFEEPTQSIADKKPPAKKKKTTKKTTGKKGGAGKGPGSGKGGPAGKGPGTG